MNVLIVILFIAIVALCLLNLLLIGSHEKRIQKIEQTIIKDRKDIADYLNETLKNKK